MLLGRARFHTLDGPVPFVGRCPTVHERLDVCGPTCGCDGSEELPRSVGCKDHRPDDDGTGSSRAMLETFTMDAHDPAAHHEDHTHSDRASTSPRPMIDPVCGMEVDPLTARHRAEHEGREIFFCSAGCRERFLSDPSHWTRARRADSTASKSEQSDVEYTCPMHPQVVQKG